MAELMHPSAYQTFQATRLPDTRIKTACEDVGCAAWTWGWESHVDERTELGRAQAAYIRWESGRTFQEQRTGPPGAGLTVFKFDPHQRCFREHETQGAVLHVRAGDLRGNLGLIREHSRAADWQEDFEEHQGRLADQAARG